MSQQRPILFLDVDGVIIPYGDAAVPDSATVALAGPETDNPLLARIDPEHGARLLELACDLVWATGWSDEANVVISPRVGLPQLPVLPWSIDDIGRAPVGLHWKTRDLMAFASGRPFVWIDDEIGIVDREWVEAHHAVPALLHHVDGHVGLTDADIVTIGRWLAQLSAAGE